VELGTFLQPRPLWTGMPFPINVPLPAAGGQAGSGTACSRRDVVKLPGIKILPAAPLQWEWDVCHQQRLDSARGKILHALD